MNLRPFLVIFCGLFCLWGHAQLEASIWYFGSNAGLDFRSGAPVALTDGALVTAEGCATISDNMGNLLFYTDGSTIWNSNHDEMPNGNDLGGNTTSTQSAIIIPNPGNPNLFYVFTTPGQFLLGDPGLRYSEIDLTLDGGLGDVTALKNVLVHEPVPEKITAVQHANGRDIWVVTHHWGSNTLAAYLVTPAGLNPTPVISNVGFDMDYQTVGDDIFLAIGAIKTSPDGTRLAIAHNRVGVELFDFDTATGQVSNPVRLKEGNEEYYGVEFSPNNELLYLSIINGGGVLQYDLNATDIPASEVEITDSPLVFALQLGIDGKMYIAMQNSPFLGAINQPNVVGTGCDFELQAVDLGTGISNLGLPPFIQSYFFIDDIQAENLCFGEPTQFSINVSEPIVSINWDFGDGTTSTLETPTHTYLAPGTYTVSVIVSTASGTETKISDITIAEVPVANPSGPIEGCTSYGSYNLDLPSFDPTFLGAQDPTIFSVSYHLSQADADNNANALTGVHVFDYGVTPVYVRVSNNQNPACYDTTLFDVVARQAPLVDTVTDWVVCDDDLDGLYSFDLSLKDDEIFNGQDTTIFELLYFASQADADAGTNPLPNPYTNTQAMEEVFFRFQNRTYTSCFRTGSFNLEVLEGMEAHTPTDLQYCDDNNDGQAFFDLTQTETEIIGTQNAASLIITFHETQPEAENGTNAVDAANYWSTAYQNTIYVRVENASDSSCYDTTSFQLQIFDTPVAPTVADWMVCDDNNDGRYLFDLLEKSNEIGHGLPNVTVSFFVTQADAEVSLNPILGNYENATNPQTLYFRLENNSNALCFAIGSVALQVVDVPTAFPPTDMVICDVDETGRYTFDLSQKDAEILNGQNDQVYEVSYHSSELDALNNVRPLAKTNYQNTEPNETLWARIQHQQVDFCYDTTSFALRVNPLPQPNLEATYVICPDDPDLTIDGGIFETYEWRNATNTVVGNTQELTVTELGAYTLTVTTTQNGVSCENTASFEVLSSGAPERFTVETSGLSDTVRLIVDAIGIGPFEYSVDGVNYQESNVFEVFPGSYTVYVRDPLECRILTEDIIAMGYQKFFSPNGDGTNEYWNIIGGELYPDSWVYVYDRYGKLLRQFSPTDPGWDGTYLDRQMPASDYWFRYEYDAGKVLTGHFALKR